MQTSLSSLMNKMVTIKTKKLGCIKEIRKLIKKTKRHYEYL